MEIQHLSYDDMNDLPPTVYKYRTWTNDLHKEIISKQIVFMAKPSSFEDPLDCKLPKRFDLLTNEDIYNKYLQDSIQNYPSRTQDQHKQFAKACFKTSPMRNKEHIKQIQADHLTQYDNRFGVLSLTSNPKIYSMWDKYAENHHGFCIGFDSKKMFKTFGGGGKVIYDILPDLLPFDSHEIEHYKQLFSKETKWEFEEEYRTYKFYPQVATTADRKIKLPKECFKEVIFGARQPEVQRKEISSLCYDQGLDVKFYKETIHENEIRIESMPCR